MAAPPEMSTKDLSGKWTMNKTLSSDMDDVFQLQGLSWFLRKGISYATITLHVNHYTGDDDKLEHIDIEQTATGGIKGTTENRTLDWQPRPHSDHIFGNVVGRSRRVKVEDVEDPFLAKGWAAEEAVDRDAVELAKRGEGWDDGTKQDGLVESYVVCDEGCWTATQIWGFEVVDGERRYVRHLKFESTKDGGEHKKRLDKTLVYDYQGPL